MATEVVVPITHANEGIRLSWPDSTSQVFGAPIDLAEIYAREMRLKAAALRELTVDCAGWSGGVS